MATVGCGLAHAQSEPVEIGVETVPIVETTDARPRIDVVFALDTTGSMSGLIASAKERIWSIASSFALAKSEPEVRMGLVAFRDRGDAYVTQRTSLSTDLDALHSALMRLQAGGGGDRDESVNQALHEAVTMMDWRMDAGTFRVVFLVGDSPPHMDYEDDVPYLESCRIAALRGIVVNTIQCGNTSATTPIWDEIAKAAEGRMFQVEQSGGAVAVTTPFDAELAELSMRNDATRQWYGTAVEQRAQIAKDDAARDIHLKASISSQAYRADFNVSGRSGLGNWIGQAKELLTDLDNGVVELSKLKEEELPEALRAVPADEREAWIQAMRTERETVQQRINELGKKRREHIAMEAAKNPARASWESAVLESVREQARKSGVDLATGNEEPPAEAAPEGGARVECPPVEAPPAEAPPAEAPPASGEAKGDVFIPGVHW